MNSPRYLKRALFWLVTTTAMYFLMNGAQIFETVLIVPKWTAAPPASLAMFQGEFGLDFKTFGSSFTRFMSSRSSWPSCTLGG